MSLIFYYLAFQYCSERHNYYPDWILKLFEVDRAYLFSSTRRSLQRWRLCGGHAKCSSSTSSLLWLKL